MREFRTLVLWSHLVLGLTGATFLAITGLTGGLITIQHAVHARLDRGPVVTRPATMPSLNAIVAAIESERGAGQVASVDVSGAGALRVTLRDGSAVYVDPATRSIIGVRSSVFPRVVRLGEILIGLHANVMLGLAGRPFVLLATAESLLLAASGLWLWWRRKHWRFAWRGSPFRVSWDLHNATGIWFVVPVATMAGTAMLMAFPGPFLRTIGEAGTPWAAPPAVSVPAGHEALTPIALDRALEVADSTVAGPVLTLGIPAGNEAAYRVEKGAATVWIERYSGAVAAVRTAEPTTGDRIIETVNRVHTGEQFGPAGEIGMAVASLMLALMALTGVVLGWKRLTITFGARRRA